MRTTLSPRPVGPLPGRAVDRWLDSLHALGPRARRRVRRVSGRTIGTVVGLWRYPVKSMAEESLDAVDVAWHGLAGDRRWAFVRDGMPRSGFPWLTIRELPAMRHYVPFFAEPDRPDDSRTMVRTPGGDELEVIDPALADELGGGVRVIKQNVGVFDTMPLSLITTQSIASLGSLGRACADARALPPEPADRRGRTMSPSRRTAGSARCCASATCTCASTSATRAA